MKLIFGCGYLGRHVAKLGRDAGEHINVVTRSNERAVRFRQQGFDAITADVTQPETLTNLPGAAVVLFAVGFDHTSGQTITSVFSGGVRNVLAALPEDTGRFIYISTTGVYGDAAGGWIDERTPTDPRREGGRAALAAEQALAAHRLGNNAVILRLAGLYGPGRVPFLDKLRAGEAIPAIPDGYLNLIHVDDAARVVLAADQLAPFRDGPRIYCVSDGEPVRRGDYYREVARQIGAPPPQFITPDLASPRAARAEADRRVRNARMLEELNVQLMYPDYRTGLAAIVRPG
jgi:nucleoside-diphosphate-sugar epimerase